MNSREALARIEERYGSVDDLVYYILDEKREALDESKPVSERAAMLGLPTAIFARVIASPDFRAMMRADMVNETFGFKEEGQHIDHMSKVAQGRTRLVMSSKGEMGNVDQAPGDVIAAGKYLNELRGTPVERKDTALGGLVVNFHMAQGDTSAAPRTVIVEAEVHAPSRAGDLPPAGVLSRSSGTVPSDQRLPKELDAGLGAFYGDSAKEALHELPLADLEPASNARPQRHDRRASFRSRPPYDDDVIEVGDG